MPWSNYLGYRLLTSYDTAGCAGFCNGIAACKAFSIRMSENSSVRVLRLDSFSDDLMADYQRVPSVEPSWDSTNKCYNPASTVQIMCSLWNRAIVKTDLETYFGSHRGGFEVAIIGESLSSLHAYASERTVLTIGLEHRFQRLQQELSGASLRHDGIGSSRGIQSYELWRRYIADGRIAFIPQPPPPPSPPRRASRRKAFHCPSYAGARSKRPWGALSRKYDCLKTKGFSVFEPSYY